jgi:phage shock protein PspC (stress-responsive transcriptional regulator)
MYEQPEDRDVGSYGVEPRDEPVPRLWRSRTDRVFAGVVGGLAEKFGMDALPLRLLYSVLLVASGGVLAIPYFAIWAITRARGPRRSGPRLWRSRSNRMIAGVLGGLSEKLDVPPTLTRITYATFTLFTAVFPGILMYLIWWAATSEPEYHVGEE